MPWPYRTVEIRDSTLPVAIWDLPLSFLAVFTCNGGSLFEFHETVKMSSRAEHFTIMAIDACISQGNKRTNVRRNYEYIAIWSARFPETFMERENTYGNGRSVVSAIVDCCCCVCGKKPKRARWRNANDRVASASTPRSRRIPTIMTYSF